MAKIFCIANQKGGVGKTTTTVNLAAGLAKVGQRVLMIDLDPQGNATMGCNVDKRKLTLSVYDVLLESASVAEARVRSEKCGIDVLGANRELAGAEVELVGMERRDKRLKEALAAVDGEYDFILIDCPPSLSMLTLNGLCCAHGPCPDRPPSTSLVPARPVARGASGCWPRCATALRIGRLLHA